MGSQAGGKKKPWERLFAFGIVSSMLYVVLLMKQDVITDYFGRGGLYALLPILTAFVFSYIHGTFTGDFWTVMGVEASRKKEGK